MSDEDFIFTLENDTDEDFQFLWIDYDGRGVSYGELVGWENKTQKSYEGHAWFLKGKNKYYVFTCGQGQFAVTNSSVAVSSLI